MKIIFCLFLFIACFLISCGSLKKATQTKQFGDIVILQGKKNHNIQSDKQSIQLDREAFTIKLYSKKYNSNNQENFITRITASLDQDILNLAQLGENIKESSSFYPSRALAITRGIGYEQLYLNKEAHHILYYENEEDKTISLLSKNEEVLTLGFTVPTFWKDGNSFSIQEATFSSFYLLIFIDKNLDQIINEGELKKVRIDLK